MGLRFALWSAFCLFVSLDISSAAPKLRLSTAAVGPVAIAPGSNAPSQTVEATNAGDGALNLQYSSSVSWMSAAGGDPANCAAAGCIPIVISLNTAPLTSGTYTGVLTVTDPNALDAPQYITVTVQPGGTVPDRLDFYTTPTGPSDEYAFNTLSNLAVDLKTQDSNPWLSISLEGAGSFRFTYPWRVRATPQPGQAEGGYAGTITVNGSSFSADNKTVPVTYTITSQPIAVLSSQQLMLRAAQGGPPVQQGIGLSNRGLGTLAISGASGADGWLTGTPNPDSSGVLVSADPSGFSPGSYQSTLVVSSNAAQGDIRVPVQLNVVASGAPVTYFGGVATYTTGIANDVLAQGTLASISGEQFTYGAAQTATPPYTPGLGGTQVFVNDQPAPIQSTSYNQVVFQVPYNATLGDGVLRIDRDGQRGNSVSIRVADTAPRILTAGDYGNVLNSDGTPAVPAALGGHPARRGDTITIAAIGMGLTSPAVDTGSLPPGGTAPSTNSQPSVSFASGPFSISTTVATSAVLSPDRVGVFLVTVTIPPDAPVGDGVLLAIGAGSATSNSVRIAIAQ